METDEVRRLRLQLSQMTMERDNWRETARRYATSLDFYRGILVQIGKMFGREAFTSDDGSLQESVLTLKIPELVQKSIALSMVEEWKQMK